MATSSFSKTFIFGAAEAKKIRDIKTPSETKMPSVLYDRTKEGREALAHFSSRSKK